LPQVGILTAVGELAQRASAIAARTAGNIVSPAVTALMQAAAIATGHGELLTFAGPVGAFAGSLTEEGVYLVREAWTDRARRVEAFAEAVSEEAGVPIDETPLLAVENRSARRLLGITVENATEAESEWRVRMLAKAFVHGVKDPAKVDTMAYLIRVLKPLDVPHVRLLAVVADAERNNEGHPLPAIGRRGVQLKEALHSRDRNLLPVLEILRLDLLTSAVIAENVNNGGYNLTDLGAFCTEALLSLDAMPAPADTLGDVRAA
jgi:hypothetical protein